MSLQVEQHKPNWFIGKTENLVFFGTSKEQVTEKYWAHLKNNLFPISQKRIDNTARKLIELETEFNRSLCS